MENLIPYGLAEAAAVLISGIALWRSWKTERRLDRAEERERTLAARLVAEFDGTVFGSERFLIRNVGTVPIARPKPDLVALAQYAVGPESTPAVVEPNLTFRFTIERPRIGKLPDTVTFTFTRPDRPGEGPFRQAVVLPDPGRDGRDGATT